MAAPTRNRIRTGGSTFTVFKFMGQPLAFCQQVAHQAPRPVAAPVAIHPMDEPYPVQVITPAAAGMGSLTLNIWELYNAKVWDRLGAEVGATASQPLGGNQNTTSIGNNSILFGAVDIADVFVRVAEQRPEDLTVVKYIRPPVIAGTKGQPYHEIYHNAVITDIRDDEQISVGTMEVIKQIDIGYTHMTRPGFGENGSGKSRATTLRDRPLG